MNRVSVMLHIIPSGVRSYELEDFDESQDGKIMSNTREIKVNKVLDGYSILYDSETMKRLNMGIFGANVIKLFKGNLPTAVIDFGIVYHFELLDRDDEYDVVVAEKIFELDARMLKTNDPTFRYHRTESVKDCIEYYEDLNGSDEDEDDDEDEHDSIRDFVRTVNDYQDDDDEDGGVEDIFSFLTKDSIRKKKSKKKDSVESYGRSRVFRNAKNPKRSYHRHGVLIAHSKDDLRKDEKVIKEFLKDFFPGSAEWKKDFRDDVLKRWIRMFVITKRKLKRIEKDYQKSSSRSRIEADKAIDFTRRLFNVPLDHWNDPSK